MLDLQERADNWREKAFFGQRAFAEVASAISQFESVTIGVSSTQVSGLIHSYCLVQVMN